jgi:hypothetical protein
MSQNDIAPRESAAPVNSDGATDEFDADVDVAVVDGGASGMPAAFGSRSDGPGSRGPGCRQKQERALGQGRRRGAGAGFSAGGFLAAALRTGLATSTASGSPWARRVVSFHASACWTRSRVSCSW